MEESINGLPCIATAGVFFESDTVKKIKDLVLIFTYKDYNDKIKLIDENDAKLLR